MAATITLASDGRGAAGDKLTRRGTGNLGTYATGGLAVTKANFDLPVKLSSLRIEPISGYVFEVVSLADTGATLVARTSVQTYTATYDPASLAAVTARDDAITVTGVAATDIVVGWQAAAALTNGLSIQEARVSGANTITVRLNNASAGAIDGASGTWTFYVAKANGALNEVANGVDLSAVTFNFTASGN